MLALWSLKGLGELSDEDIERCLDDSSADIREQAIRLAEPRLDSSPKLLERVLSQSHDPDSRIDFQLAFTLGETKDARAIPVLAGIARKNATNQWIRTAVLSSVSDTADRLFVELLSDDKFAGSSEGVALLTQLSRIVGSRGRDPEVQRILQAVSENGIGIRLRNAVVLGLGNGMKQSGAALPDPNSLPPLAAKFLGSLISRAESDAIDRKQESGKRLLAIQLLGCLDFKRAEPILVKLLDPVEPQDVQLATLDVLAEYKDPSIAQLVIAQWKEYMPVVCARAIRLLLSRDEWAEEYLAAVAEGKTPAAQIDTVGRTKLLQHRKVSIRLAAEKLFANSPRQAVIANYKSVLQRPGDPSRGFTVFKRECSGCHRVRGEGYEVGPDLASSPSRDPEALLTNILDPNRFVDPSNLQYMAVDKSGRTFSGKIAGETATSITLTSGKSVNETILRSNIEEFFSTGKSLMPEGLENTISKEEMANLVAFLNGLESTPGTVKLPLVGGTRPGTVEP
jgi:putative heme-binding domain-containing protein